MNEINKCIELLDKDKVLLLPTETVYGLMCDYKSKAGRDKIYKIKQRDKNKLFQMLISDISMLENFEIELTEPLKKLIDKFCPGAITIVVTQKNGDTIGFRMPDHEFILNLICKYGKPLAATSANISGNPAALSIEQALADFADVKPDYYIDMGKINDNSLASTVVQIIDNKINILREGIISKKEIFKTVK